MKDEDEDGMPYKDSADKHDEALNKAVELGNKLFDSLPHARSIGAPYTPSAESERLWDIEKNKGRLLRASIEILKARPTLSISDCVALANDMITEIENLTADEEKALKTKIGNERGIGAPPPFLSDIEDIGNF